MGRKPLSSYSPAVAAQMRADLARKMREAWEKRESNKLGSRINGVFQTDVQKQISKSVKSVWEKGGYDERVNGMLGRTGSQVSSWGWGRNYYAQILAQFEDPVCRFCGNTEHLNAHHIDEDHDNYLLSNLVWACVPCHMWLFHYRTQTKQIDANTVIKTRRPFVTNTRRAKFEYSHILPWHPGKCARLHGHSGHLSVSVKRRLDPNGVAIDFSELKSFIKLAVLKPLDHRFLNDFIPNPTSENLLLWVWESLELSGLKGLSRVEFSETDLTSVSFDKTDVIEAFGWDKIKGVWKLVPKAERMLDGRA